MCIWAFLSIKKKLIPTQFSLHFGEKTFWWAWGENIWVPPFTFLLPYLTKHTPKKFSSLFFSSKFFIHPISPPNKHTLKDVKTN